MEQKEKQNAETEAEALIEANNANEAELIRRVREAYENSAEYQLGCKMLDELTQRYSLSSEEALSMLTGEFAPQSAQIVGARAAEALELLEKDGKLKRGIESYLGDEGFLSMLRQMPAELAIRLREAEWAAEGAENARREGERSAIERILAKKSMPVQMRTNMPASGEPDFKRMSADEFIRFKKSRFGM